MKFGGRVAAAIEILEEIETRKKPVSDALRDWGAAHRFAGSSDRGVIRNIVYDVLRKKNTSAWIMNDDPSARNLVFGLLLSDWEMHPDLLVELLSKDKFSPTNISAEALSTIKENLKKIPPENMQANCPDWCIKLLHNNFGKDWLEEAKALSSRPPLDIRVNTLRTNRDTFLVQLQQNKAIPCCLSPYGIRIPAGTKEKYHPNICLGASFQQGFFEIQDEGSQILSLLTNPKQNDTILDFCAGAGGKTLSIAACLKNTGQIFAYDIERERLARISPRIKRSSAQNIQPIFTQENLKPLEKKMDIVLLDVPCTGSGIWRRKPDIKWSFTEKNLQESIEKQKKIIHTACNFVKPGGKLVYMTCSIFKEENTSIIDDFLTNNPLFSLLDYTSLWEKYFPQKKEYAKILEKGILLSPFTTKTDGFFFSVLERKK